MSYSLNIDTANRTLQFSLPKVRIKPLTPDEVNTNTVAPHLLLNYTKSNTPSQKMQKRWGGIFGHKHLDRKTAAKTDDVLIKDGKKGPSYEVSKQAICKQLGIEKEELEKHLIKTKGGPEVVVDPKFLSKCVKNIYIRAVVYDNITEKFAKLI